MEETIERTTHIRKAPIWSLESPWMWMVPALLLLVVYSIYPLIFNIFTSFQEFNPVSHSFEWVGLKNWAYIFQDERTLNALKNTFSYMAIALTVELVLGMAIALLFDSKIYLKGLWQTLIILPMVTPPAIAWIFMQWATSADICVRANLLGGGATPMRYGSFTDPRIVANNKVMAGTTRHFAVTKDAIENWMGTEPHLPSWASLSVDNFAVELGKMTTGQQDVKTTLDNMAKAADEAAAKDM